MSYENWILYIIGLIVTSIGAVWIYLKTTYLPHKLELEKIKLEAELELQKKKEEAAEKQRQHDYEMAKRVADEQERHRQHERELAMVKVQTEAQEGSNIWKQVVEMQTTLMKRDEDKTEFIIGLATDRMDRQDERAREAAKEIALAHKEAAQIVAKGNEAVAHQLKEIRANLSVLVQDAAARDEERENLKKIPQLLLELLLQQNDFQKKFLREIRNGHQEITESSRQEDSSNSG